MQTTATSTPYDRASSAPLHDRWQLFLAAQPIGKQIVQEALDPVPRLHLHVNSD